MDYYMIGQKIRKFRKGCGLSQEQLAEKVGISTTHLSHIETGNTKLSLPVFVDIAEALSVQTDELLYDTPSINLSTKAEILNVLDSCSTQDFYILRDIINATKCSLDSTEINSLTINKEPDRKKIPQRILSDPVLWLVYSFIMIVSISII